VFSRLISFGGVPFMGTHRSSAELSVGPAPHDILAVFKSSRDILYNTSSFRQYHG
jgi:hypothetical protein